MERTYIRMRVYIGTEFESTNYVRCGYRPDAAELAEMLAVEVADSGVEGVDCGIHGWEIMSEQDYHDAIYKIVNQNS